MTYLFDLKPIVRLKKLEYLDIVADYVRPIDLAKFKNLRYFRGTQNTQNFPGIGSLQKLEEIWMYDPTKTWISTLPPSVTRLTFAGAAWIGHKFENLPNLKHLEITGARNVDFKKFRAPMERLEILGLTTVNNLDSAELLGEKFPNLKVLVHSHLAKAQIAKLEEHVPQGIDLLDITGYQVAQEELRYWLAKIAADQRQFEHPSTGFLVQTVSRFLHPNAALVAKYMLEKKGYKCLVTRKLAHIEIRTEHWQAEPVRGDFKFLGSVLVACFSTAGKVVDVQVHPGGSTRCLAKHHEAKSFAFIPSTTNQWFEKLKGQK